MQQVIELSQVRKNKCESYIIRMIESSQKANFKKNSNIMLQRVVNEFDRFLINDKNMIKYHKNDSHEIKFRLFLESFTKSIKIEYHTFKQRELLFAWTRNFFTVNQRDIAYELFYKEVYKTFSSLCAANGIQFCSSERKF